ncbi:MAG TPA: T9SS type A sorting domain-containing protein, partial [Paludibacter sp.]|nr:T9SS type A sorting domain-containing protein [Paludibacter sp.]
DIQFGTVSVANVGWNPVMFGKSFATLPAIITSAATNNNSTVLLTPRVKYTSSSRFTLQLAPWRYQNVSTLSKEDAAPYLVLAPGEYDFGGLKAIANASTKIGASWTTVVFPTPFDTVPVVFASQLLPASTFATCLRVRNVTRTGFEAKIQKETAVTTVPSTETVSYFAITRGKGMINGSKVIVGRTANNYVGSVYKSINYGDSIGNPVFMAQMQTCTDDTVTAALRCLSIYSKYANVVKQRERSTGVVSTLADAVGWMVIDPVGVSDEVNSPSVSGFNLYPNPATDYLAFGNENSNNMQVEIFNMYGVLVKRETIANNKINVADLPPGSYVLKTKNWGANKFVKL